MDRGPRMAPGPPDVRSVSGGAGALLYTLT
jgi:hypothetical protein